MTVHWLPWQKFQQLNSELGSWNRIFTACRFNWYASCMTAQNLAVEIFALFHLPRGNYTSINTKSFNTQNYVVFLMRFEFEFSLCLSLSLYFDMEIIYYNYKTKYVNTPNICQQYGAIHIVTYALKIHIIFNN